jgi:hypothetical protein
MKALLIAALSVLVLADVAFAGVLLAHRATTLQQEPVAAQASTNTHGQHPCNHGFYVSQAAHAKKGGAYVSGIAKGNLGKDKTCTAKLPGS